MDYDSRLDTKEHQLAVLDYLLLVLHEVSKRSIEHDESKLIGKEKEVLDTYIPQLRNVQFGSNEYFALLEKMKPGTDLHYRLNRHHPEHFQEGVGGMNLVDVIEMVADWMAAVKRNPNGDIMKSIEINQQRYGFSDDLKQILANTADWLGSIK